MDFNDYQTESRKHAFYPNQNTPDAFRYLIYGITGEAGELAEHFKHALRDEDDKISPERRDLIIKEISDILWYLANICTELGVDFNEIPKVGLKKIEDRLKRGTLQGSGNTR
ncbi:MAG: nucleoside triphosphate pyrophosphohydrolase family protein [Patescibacteria group bacterium]